jgi:hypothetical protein
MIKLLVVSYVRLGTRDLVGATRFAVDYLGLKFPNAKKRQLVSSRTAR